MAHENQHLPRAVHRESITRDRTEVQLPPKTPAGIPLLAQAKYWAARRALESYAAALNAQAAAFTALAGRERAKQDFAKTLVLTEHIDDLRQIEELKVVQELAALVQASELRELHARTAKANAEADAIEAERRLAALREPKPETASGPKISAAEQTRADIVRMKSEGEALKRDLIDIYGGEVNLSPEDRELISQVDVAIRNKIVDRLESL